MLTRWDPFQEMINLRSAVDRLFDSTLAPSNSLDMPTAWTLALDIVENEDSFLVKASVPGIKPEDIQVTFTDNVLTIKGEMRSETASKETRYHLRERRFGSFTRSVTLGARIKADAIVANYENGVLTLTLPKAEEVKPKQISIKVNPVLEAKTK